MLTRRAVLSLVLLAACAPGSTTAPTQPELAGSFTWLDTEGGVRVGRYTSKPWGFSTNSFVIATDAGSVIVDAQFLPSAARELLAVIEAEGAGPVVGAVVLHPNPDKFNGTATLQAAGISVWTSAEVLEHIDAVFEQRTRAFAERYAPDWPDQTPRPTSLEGRTELELGEARLVFHRLGPGCSAAHLVVELRRGAGGGEIFVGDLASGDTHLWLELGQLDAWRERLAELRALEPVRVHPGRGASGGVELLARNDAYLGEVRELVLASEPGEAGRDAILETMRGRYPELDYLVFLELGLPAVAQALPALAGSGR